MLNNLPKVTQYCQDGNLNPRAVCLQLMIFCDASLSKFPNSNHFR